MKFVDPRPFADPEAAARKLMEIANAVGEVGQSNCGSQSCLGISPI
jgi:hypothetical protein